jgi:hypothetical protein
MDDAGISVVPNTATDATPTEPGLTQFGLPPGFRPMRTFFSGRTSSKM